MKNMCCALLLALCCFFAPACKDQNKSGERADEKNVISADNVPDEVKTAFAVKYPSAKDIIWETAHEMEYKTIKVKFQVDGKFMKSEFKMDGSLVKEGPDNS